MGLGSWEKMRRQRYRYNELKRRVPRAVWESRSGWLTAAELMRRVEFCALSSARSYLKRLYHFGLLRRHRYPLLEYALTPKGLRRLRWLESR